MGVGPPEAVRRSFFATSARGPGRQGSDLQRIPKPGAVRQYPPTFPDFHISDTPPKGPFKAVSRLVPIHRPGGKPVSPNASFRMQPMSQGVNLAHKKSGLSRTEVVNGKHVLSDRATFYQVFLDNPVKNISCYRVIPHPIGVHHCYGPLLADAEAVDLGPENPAVSRTVQVWGLGIVSLPARRGRRYVESFGCRFEAAPSGNALLEGRATGIRLLSAQKDMAFQTTY